MVKTADKVHRVRVVTGAMDGTNAEIKSGLNANDEVVLSMSSAGMTATAASAATAPHLLQQIRSCHNGHHKVEGEDRIDTILMKKLIEIISLKKDYFVGEVTVHALRE